MSRDLLNFNVSSSERLAKVNVVSVPKLSELGKELPCNKLFCDGNLLGELDEHHYQPLNLVDM